MDRKELYSLILQDLDARTEWETKQRIWYQMRHDGLPRKSKPLGNASADLHFPLSDTTISKFKSFYKQQIFGTDKVASFIPRKEASAQEARVAEEFYDYKIRYCSNLKFMSRVLIDQMLMSGTCVMKVLWDHEDDELEFDAVEPLNLIVPWYTRDIQDADRITQVIAISVEKYKTIKEFNQDPEFIKKISGTDALSQTDKESSDRMKYQREGFTRPATDKEIVMWEVWTRENGEVCRQVFSPQCIQEDIIPCQESPFNHGLYPYVQFYTEIKEKRFFSARGIPEQQAMEEAYLTKLMNEKADAITLTNRPVYAWDGNGIPPSSANTNNITLKTGQVIPYSIRAIQNPPPPIDFDKEMMQMRQIAEARVGSPDFGIQTNQTPLAPDRTKYEVQQAVNLSMIQIDERADIFRDCLTRMHRMAWSVLLQYNGDNFVYFYRNEMHETGEEVLKDAYMLVPSGSVDSYNKDLVLQRSMQRFQIFNGDPFINQAQLRIDVLESVDPSDVKRLFINPAQSSGGQQEEQAKECLLMENGFPAQVDESDDHIIHIQTVLGRIQMLQMLRIPFNPIAANLYTKHFNDHLFYFKQAKGKQAPEADQYEKQFKMLLSLWANPQPQIGQPTNDQMVSPEVPAMA